MPLNRESYNQLVDLLLIDALTGTSDQRHVLYSNAFRGIDNPPRIDVRSGTQYQAVSHMVYQLELFGSIGDKPALWILLEHIIDPAQALVGEETRAKIQALEPQIRVRRTGATRASLYDDPDDVDYLPRAGLIGRDAVKAQVLAQLQAENARVLLQGFGGIGKTALAAQIACEWLADNGGKVLWLRLSSDNTETAFEALAQPFNASQVVAYSADEAKSRVLRQAIRDNDVSLVVLDDVWNGATLNVVERAIPRNVPLLVTARQRYPMMQIIAIPDLTPDTALDLLRKIAGGALTADETASRQLCATLGHLAFAIEVAANTMKASSYDAQKMLAEVQATDVTQLTVPLEYSENGRETITALIQTTLNVLPDDAKKAFLAWGVFWSNKITPEMLEIYFENTDTDNIPNIENALNQLHLYGLATCILAVNDEASHPISVSYYQLHDLAFAFTTAQTNDEQRHEALNTCLAYIKRYSQPSRENFAALEPEVDNCLGAATFAMQHERYSDVEQFAWDLNEGCA